MPGRRGGGAQTTDARCSGYRRHMMLLDNDLLVINQKAKLIELTNEYAIRDADGADLGVIRQEGQSTVKKLARFVSSLDQFMTHALSVYQADGAKVLEVTRPRKIMKSTVQVADGQGTPLGTIRQQNMIGKINFGLHDATEAKIGEIRAENWRAWDFAIVDVAGQEVARITKTWEGLAKTMFTTADNYILKVEPQCQGTLRWLVFASAVSVDLALKQDARGFG
jgi:uncharacterized protein YxjI